jgi:hypothetical protein
MMSSFETTQDDETWSTWLANADVNDVYYSARYGRIWAHEERGSFIGIRYESPAGRVLYPLLLVPLDSLPGGSGLSEARTPYDFGGPMGEGDDLEALHRAFRAALLDWFHSRRVISEFARIHPLSPGGRPADAKLHAENFVVDLTVAYDDLFSSQHRRHRRAVRAFTRRHGEANVISDLSPDDASSFIELYELTMNRVGAGSDYYFTRETLSALMSLDEMRLVRAEGENHTCGAALFLRAGSNLFYFLGASASERPPGTNNAIFDAAIRHAQSQGLLTLHLGGGGESLRQFKSQIASGTVPYYLLQRIIDEPRYAALCEACGVSASAHFPPFRSMLVEQRHP